MTRIVIGRNDSHLGVYRHTDRFNAIVVRCASHCNCMGVGLHYWHQNIREVKIFLVHA